MPRKINLNKRFSTKETKFNSFLISILLNKILKNGKKSLAKRILTDSFTIIQQILHKDAKIVLEKAIRNISPRVYLRPKYLGDKTYYVPVLLNRFKSTVLAITWLIAAAKKRKKNTIAENLSNEILDAWKGIGGAIKKKEEIHKMSEANKAFLSLDENE